jgi:hypothetical protein
LPEMNWVFVLNIIAVAAFFLPIAALLFTRLAFHKTFPLLLLYFIIAFIDNLLAGNFVVVSPELKKYIGITNNILDGPLVLGFMPYLCYTLRQKQLLKKMWLGIIGLTVVTVAITGFGVNAIRIVLGPSILLTIFFNYKFFIHYIRTTIRNPHAATGKALISASLLFAYGAYLFIYILYYVMRSKNLEDAYMIYFLSSIFSAALISIGVLYEAKRYKRIKEVQVMRRELAILYEGEKNNPGKKRIRSLDELFDFDPSKVIPGFRN